MNTPAETLRYAVIDPAGFLYLRTAEIAADRDRLTALQAAVHGYIETAGRVDDGTGTDTGIDAWVNEEGRLLNDPRMRPNPVGSLVVARLIGQQAGELFVGPVVFSGRLGEDTVSLTAGQEDRIGAAYTAAAKLQPPGWMRTLPAFPVLGIACATAAASGSHPAAGPQARPGHGGNTDAPRKATPDLPQQPRNGVRR